MSQLTKEDLVNIYKITEVKEDGRIFMGKREILGGVDRPHTTDGRTYVRKRIHIKDVNGNLKHLLVSRVVYAWYHGEAHDGMMIDHIDGNPLNNSISNLREVTHRENVDYYYKEQIYNKIDRLDYVKAQIEELKIKMAVDTINYNEHKNMVNFNFIVEDERKLGVLTTALKVMEDIQKEIENK